MTGHDAREDQIFIRTHGYGVADLALFERLRPDRKGHIGFTKDIAKALSLGSEEVTRRMRNLETGRKVTRHKTLSNRRFIFWVLPNAEGAMPVREFDDEGGAGGDRGI